MATMKRNGDFAVSRDITATRHISGVNLTATGNISGVNITGTGNVSGVNLSASSNISGVNITASSNISGVNITGSGNVSGVNLSASSHITAGGNITAGTNGDITGRHFTARGKINGDTIMLGNVVTNTNNGIYWYPSVDYGI